MPLTNSPRAIPPAWNPDSSGAPPARLNASLFRVTLDDQVGFLADPLPAAAPFGSVGVGGSRRQSVGSMRNDGVDLSASLNLRGRRGLVARSTDTFRSASTRNYWTPAFARARLPVFARNMRPSAWSDAAPAGSATRLPAAPLLTAVGRQNGSDIGRPEFDIPAHRLEPSRLTCP